MEYLIFYFYMSIAFSSWENGVNVQTLVVNSTYPNLCLNELFDVLAGFYEYMTRSEVKTRKKSFWQHKLQARGELRSIIKYTS